MAKQTPQDIRAAKNLVELGAPLSSQPIPSLEDFMSGNFIRRIEQRTPPTEIVHGVLGMLGVQPEVTVDNLEEQYEEFSAAQEQLGLAELNNISDSLLPPDAAITITLDRLEMAMDEYRDSMYRHLMDRAAAFGKFVVARAVWDNLQEALGSTGTNG